MTEYGIRDLAKLRAGLRPALDPDVWVFCVPDRERGERIPAAESFATVCESEGITHVVRHSFADENRLPYQGVFRRITLSVHSSLEAVGLTALVAGALTTRDISANVIAGFYHDHVFVPADRAVEALELLEELACSGS